LRLIPLFLLILILPLGVAGQNIGVGVVTLGMLILCFANRSQLSQSLQQSFKEYQLPFVAGLSFCLWMAFSVWVNPDHPTNAPTRFIAGYSIWLLFPLVTLVTYRNLNQQDWRRLFVFGSIVSLVWGGLIVSQTIFGWKVSGISFVPGSTRAQGLYSHPLTLAYVVLLGFPLSVSQVVKRPRDLFAWFFLFGFGAGILASQSRTVQVIGIGILLYNAFRYSQGKARWWFVTSLTVVLLLGAITDNPVRARFVKTISGNFDRQSDYLDDRVAFWHVHWEMFKDRPIVGHGVNLDTAYRLPWYEELGLGDFTKKYEAHNMYLQTAVNGGVFGLGLFLWWYGIFLKRAYRSRKTYQGDMMLQTMGALSIAGLMQNAFQDSEVRFGVIIMVTMFLLKERPQSSES
jgi:O-antigen ligase